MSTRSNKRQSAPTEQSQWDMSDYRNWPVAKLKVELENNGIKTGTGFTLVLLRKLYAENVLAVNHSGSSPPKKGRIGLAKHRTTVSDIHSLELTSATGAVPAVPDTGLPGQSTSHVSHPGEPQQPDLARNSYHSSVPARDRTNIAGQDCCEIRQNMDVTIPGLPRMNTPSSSATSSSILTEEMHSGLVMAPILSLEIIDKMASLIPDSKQPPTFDLASYYKNTSANTTAEKSSRFGTSPEAVPHMDLVSPALRKSIVEGKDVNLASLLIPYFDTENKEDLRLRRPLTITEFVTAFGRFKRIMCSAYPDRREELDHYEAHIVHIYNVYGDRYYEYHKLFSLKCANALQLHKLKVDWSQLDRDLLQLVTAGAKTKFCEICREVSHDTKFCYYSSGMVKPATQQTMYNRQYTSQAQHPQASNAMSNEDVYGRARHFVNGKEVCNNFNNQFGCKRSPCYYLHVCQNCKAPSQILFLGLSAA